MRALWVFNRDARLSITGMADAFCSNRKSCPQNQPIVVCARVWEYVGEKDYEKE
jgi:hypothetical protein